MRFSDEVLMAYADNELDEKTRAAVEAALASDPELARQVAHHQRLRARLRSAFEPVIEEPVPARLLEAARNAAAASRVPSRSNVIPLPRRGARGGSIPRWAALAASLLVGVLGGWIAFRIVGSGPITMRNGHMLARGLLADALTNQLASSQSAAQPVQIGVSFRSKSGEYCRTFSMRAPAVAGLACHAARGWRLQVLTGTEEGGAATGGYRQAASSVPPPVVTAVNAEISGEPLGARAEAAARRQGWTP